MKAEKLPSGNYRVQVFDKATGKKHSITCSTKKEAERQAAVWYMDHRTERGILFDTALEEYIENRSAVLSPSTIREYKRYKMYYDDFKGVPIDNIQNDMLQAFVNSMSMQHSPKTVRNVYGLITTVLHTYAPDRSFRTTLPKKTHPDVNVPTETEVKALLEKAKGKTIEIPLLLAVFCTMRRGEIAALDPSSIDGNIIHVERAYVYTSEKKWVLKGPKTHAGDRFINCPEWIIEKIRAQGYVTKLTPKGISSNFSLLLKQAGVPHYRFHDLRHYSASMQHALGIPDVYIMQQGGWENDGVLKEIYRHTIKEESSKNCEIWKRYAAEFA